MSMLIAPQLTGPLGPYGINNAALFDGSTGYLSRTPASAGSSTTWTFRWMGKRAALGQLQYLLWSNEATTNFEIMRFTNADTLQYLLYVGGVSKANYQTQAVLRDPTAWLDIMVTRSGNTIKIWVNGVEQSLTVSTSLNGTNSYINAATPHEIGRLNTLGYHYDGYLAEVVMVDGVAEADMSKFGRIETASGNWVPRSASITNYGVNGFYLKFANGAALGEDSSGIGNDFTVNGTVTSVPNTPTNTYCTFNPLDGPAYYSVQLTEGNLKLTDVDVGTANTYGTHYFPVSEDYEFQITAFGTSTEKRGVGIKMDEEGSWGTYWYNGEDGAITSSTSGATWTNGDVIKVRVSGGEFEFFKNGVSQGVSSLGLTGNFTVFGRGGGTGYTGYGVTLDCGQRGFTPSAGYKTLCTDNLPAVTGKNVNDHFKTVLYTGTGVSHAVTGVGFQPDFVWLKNRDYASSHMVFDAARGAGNAILTDLTNAEGDYSSEFTSLDSDGFSLALNWHTSNFNGENYVAWCASLPNTKTSGWGGSPTIVPSKEIYNPTLGMSIVTYTGNGVAGATIPHSLGKKPGVVIVKSRSTVQNWPAYHASLGATKALYLNSTSAASVNPVFWNDTEPTSQLISFGTSAQTNATGVDYVAYIFAESDFIKIGSYTGNGSANGPMAPENLSPIWYLGKESSSATSALWMLFDEGREANNPKSKYLAACESWVEGTNADSFDFVATGVKARNNNANTNESDQTYVYMMIGQPTGGANTSPAPAR